jgi:hypothetical protein
MSPPPQVLLLDSIYVPGALPVTAESTKDVITNILEKPLFFLKVALVYNNLIDVNFTDDCKFTWAILPALLDSLNLISILDRVLMDGMGTRLSSYDPAMNVQLRCFLYCALEDWQASRRSSSTVLPPPLDRVRPDWNYSAVNSIVKCKWPHDVCFYHERPLSKPHVELEPLKPVRLFEDVSETVINVVVRGDNHSNEQNSTPSSRNIHDNTLQQTPFSSSTSTKSTESIVKSPFDATFGLPVCPLVKIRNKDGNTRYDSGYYAKKNCYICCGWYDKPPNTSFECAVCGMPLCNPKRTGIRIGREQTCLFEHLNSSHEETCCGGDYYLYKKFPSELKRKPLLQFPSNKKKTK